MARFLHTKQLPGLERGTWRRLVLFCCAMAGFIYFLKAQLHQRAAGEKPFVTYLSTASGKKVDPLINVTSWGAPIVWGDREESQLRRMEFADKGVTTGLAVFVIGKYSHYLQKFIVSAERYFLEGQAVTYYILTDNLRGIPNLSLRTGRKLKALYIAERPEWVHLSRTRMSLLSSSIKEFIKNEVDYLFCMDVDQVFINRVGAEILGDLVATFHPVYFNRPHYTFPYETTLDSKAYVEDSEGDYYYTSELYGGLCSEIYELALLCSQFIIQDMEMSYHAFLFEESYLNRFFINKRPSRILSPEYSWWDAPETSNIQVKRILSLQRGCFQDSESKGANCYST